MTRTFRISSMLVVLAVASSLIGSRSTALAQKVKKSKFEGNWVECKMDPKADPAKFCKCPEAVIPYKDKDKPEVPMVQCNIKDVKKSTCAVDKERSCSCTIFSKGPKSKENPDPQWKYTLYSGAGPVKKEKGLDYACFCAHE